MCGINGVFYFNQQHADAGCLHKMNCAIEHRGPNNKGVFVENNIGLGHVRLSIIDLSISGNQPMFSNDERFVLIFNGEIYNYKKLKSLLSDYSFKTSSDSEVLLAAYSKWSKQMLEYLEGMFAFIILDKNDNSLFIARDRMGIKPLYYYKDNNLMVFSSEIKGLIASGLFVPRLNRNKLPEYFKIGTVTGNDTLLENVFMLPPASSLTISNNTLTFNTYWTSSSEVNNEIEYEESKKQVRELFFKAVEKRLVSDVPFGAFLSGGIDSTAVTAAMRECMSGQIETFNISFDENQFSEAHFAREVSRKFSTHHTEIKLSPNLFLSEIEAILKSYDHPCVDGANTYIVSQATRKAGITMALSGLGGDELFGGYPVFKLLKPTLNVLQKIPFPFRKLGSMILKSSSQTKKRKLADMLSLSNPDESSVYEIFRTMMSKNESNTLVGNSIPIVKPSYFSNQGGLISNISNAEFHYYLQPVLLRDTDQMSMRHALEVRVPFLDHHLVEYVLSVPDSYKTKTNAPKSLLVESLSDLLPHDIVYRKKMGFVLPWEFWIKNELSPYVDNAIDKLETYNLLDHKQWKEAFQNFKNGKQFNNWNIFWALTVLVYWIENNKISTE